MSRISYAAIAFALLSVVPPASAQDRIETVQVADNLYMLKGGGGNIGVSIGEEGVVIIDAKVGPLSNSVQAAIRKLSDEPVEFVLNTHWHHDHTHGNAGFRQIGSIILSHENARDRMMTEQIIVPPMTGGQAPALSKESWPVITFTEELSFHLNGSQARAIHVPNAHTDGDVLIHFIDDDVVHMGDVYFSTGYPNIDVGSNGTIDGMIKAHELALSLVSDQGKVIPGHGELSSPAALSAHVEMLRTVRDRISRLIDQGLSQAEIVAMRPLDDLDPEWGQGYIKQERMVIQAYKSLTPRSDWED